MEPPFTARAGEFSEDEEQAELAEQMNAQASRQPASHTVYTVHPGADESELGHSDREGLAEADLPANSEGWEDGSEPEDTSGEAAIESEQPADPEGWDEDFPLDSVDVAQVGACTVLFCVMLLTQGLEQCLDPRQTGCSIGSACIMLCLVSPSSCIGQRGLCHAGGCVHSPLLLVILAAVHEQSSLHAWHCSVSWLPACIELDRAPGCCWHQAHTGEPSAVGRLSFAACT